MPLPVFCSLLYGAVPVSSVSSAEQAFARQFKTIFIVENLQHTQRKQNSGRNPYALAPSAGNELPTMWLLGPHRPLPVTQSSIVFSFIGGKNCMYQNYVMTKLAVRPGQTSTPVKPVPFTSLSGESVTNQR